MLGLHSCTGFSLVALLRLLIVVAPLVGQGSYSAQASVIAAPRLQGTGSAVVAFGLSWSEVGSSQRDRTRVSCIGRTILYH